MLALQFVLFALVLWLGLYLLLRDAANPLFRWSGVGQLLYASVIASQVLLGSSYAWLTLAVGFGFLVADVALGYWGVLKLGERFWPDFLRSLDAAVFSALLFAGPVAITMWVATGATLPMRALLLVMLGLVIATQLFATPLQAALDRFAFGGQLQLQASRAELRATVEALPKLDNQTTVVVIEPADFVRYTRRALSHYGDLPQLSSNPLTRLPVIEARLAARNVADHTLSRASELKQLLLEAICHLKPPGPAKFESSDAWRHYNALYFPYVVGLKPYSRRADHIDLDGTSQQALHWLQSQVPERTLYNWQNAAAQVVAQYLRELS